MHIPIHTYTRSNQTKQFCFKHTRIHIHTQDPVKQTNLFYRHTHTNIHSRFNRTKQICFIDSLSLSLSHTHTHTHTHTQDPINQTTLYYTGIHTHIHTYIHICKIQLNKTNLLSTHPHALTHTHTHIDTHTHTRTRPRTHTHTHRCRKADSHTQNHTTQSSLPYTQWAFPFDLMSSNRLNYANPESFLKSPSFSRNKMLRSPLSCKNGDLKPSTISLSLSFSFSPSLSLSLSLSLSPF